jgi:hypothetical protein
MIPESWEQPATRLFARRLKHNGTGRERLWVYGYKESLLGSVPMRVMQYWPEGKNCITSFVIKCGD